MTVTPHQVGANPHVLTAVFGATSVHSTSSESRNLTVNKASTTTTITNAAALASAATVVGESYAVQWAVSVAAPGAGTPTGMVTVSGGSGCTAAVAAGQCVVTSTSAGSKTLVATYSSDPDFDGSASTGAPHTVSKASTTTTITSDTPDPSVVGQAVTVNFSVAVNAPGAGVPTGAVTVSDGVDSCLGSVAAPSCVITFTNAGSKTLTATYAGDSDFNGSTSASAPHVVNTRATTTAVGLSPAAVVVGQASTVTVTVSDVEGLGSQSSPTGTVLLASSEGTDVFSGACVLVPSGADKGTCAVSVTPHQLGTSPHVITATFGATTVHSASSGTKDLAVSKASTTTMITSDDPDPSVTGETVTVKYTVAVNAPGAGTATGNVTISNGTRTCTDTVAAGQCTIAFATAGAHPLTASYGGDANFDVSTSSPATPHTVNKASSSTTITSDTPDPSVVGQLISVNYTVAVVSPGVGTPTGSVTVSNGTTSCIGTVASGGCTLTFTTAGAHPMTATYAGDADFNGSTSASEGHTVSKGDTDTAITSDTPDPTVVGQAYTVAVTVGAHAPAAGTPGGTVIVSDGAASCTLALSGGGGSCSLASTTAGPKTLTATYAGDGNFNGGTSPGAAHTVNQAPTATAVSSSVSPSRFGQSVTMTAVVTSVAPGAGTPAGTVEFFDGATSLGTRPLNGSGQAMFTTAAFSVGSHSLTAKYLGDGNYTASTSSLVSQTVNKADTTTTISSDTPDPSVVGQAVLIVYGVAVNAPGAGTPTGNVTVSDGTLSCTDSVATGSCSIVFTTAGPHPLTATYAGDGSFNGSTTASSSAHTVNKAATTTAITNDAPDPSVVNAGYAVTWSVTVNSPGAGVTTGTVSVTDGSATCSAAVAAGGCSLTSTTIGAKTLAATFSGDPNFLGSSGSAAHNVQYTFGGFFAPVDNQPIVNKANAGQAIPIKWRLTDSGGVGVSDPASFKSLTLYPVSCNAWSALPTDPLPDPGTSTSGLLYQGSGNWQFNWKTLKSYANSCMVARVTLLDNSTHDFDVSFK